MEQSKKKYLAPVGALLLALLLVTVITFPMLSMEVKDIPVAVFSQDEGMKTPGGTVNAGENMVKQITKSGNKALDWDVLKSNQEVQDALDDGTYYAVFTIPKDFTKAAAAGGENALKVTLDQGKNPLVSNSLTGMLTAMSEKSGMKLQTEIIHSTADYGMLAMFLPMACIMFLYIGSLFRRRPESVAVSGKWTLELCDRGVYRACGCRRGSQPDRSRSGKEVLGNCWRKAVNSILKSDIYEEVLMPWSV